MLQKKIDVLDVGAIGDMDWPFNSYKKEINFIKIDPQFSSHDHSDSKFKSVLWNINETLEMNIFNTKETSSLYPPNLNFLSYFPEVSRFNIVKKEKFETVTIDNMVQQNNINNLDFIKIDTQGAELNIIKGGEKFLSKNIVGLQIEVEFERIYEKQPLFSEVDSFIRNNLNLSLWDLDLRYFKYKSKHIKNINKKGRLIYANALYLRSIENLSEWLGELDSQFIKSKLYSLFKISLFYGYLDYCFALIESEAFKSNFDTIEIEKLNNDIKKNKIFDFPFIKNRYIYFLIKMIANHFKPSHNNWVHSNSILGNRKWFKFFSQM